MNFVSFFRTNTAIDTMRIFLTDDHEILLDGLKKIINDEDDLEVAGSASTVQDTLDQLTRLHVDLLITDYNLPDDDGLALVRAVKRKYPELKIIVLSMHDEGHLVKEILRRASMAMSLRRTLTMSSPMQYMQSKTARSILVRT